MLNRITKVSYKIYLIIAFMTLATLTISAVALYSINHIRSDFNSFQDVNQNAVEASNVEGHMLLARVHALTYRANGEKKALIASIDELKQTQVAIRGELNTSKNPVQRERLNRILVNVQEYQGHLERVSTLIDRRNELVHNNQSVTKELQEKIHLFRNASSNINMTLFENVIETEYQFTLALQHSTDFLLDNEERDFELYQAAFEQLQKKLDEFNKMFPDYTDQQMGKQIALFDKNINEVFDIIKQRNVVWNETLGALGGEITGDLQAIKQDSFTKQTSLANQVSQLSENSITAVITALLISAPLVLLICQFVTRSIVGPISTTKAIIERMADGELHPNHTVEGADEVAQMRRSLGQMEQKFYSTVQEISQNCEMLASASEQLSAINNEVLQSSVTQQQETDQVATAMNEMSAAINEVAIGANTASQEAESATEEATKGMSVMSSSMEQISPMLKN